MITEEYVVLVDKKGNVLGTEEKIAAHQKGLLHTAFSIFIFNDEGEMLLQQRAYTKYHFGGMWSNSCCSHPRLNEAPIDAAHRRLKEELGFDTPLKDVFSFIYRAEDEHTKLIEHELDTVFIGIYNDPIDNLNFDEVNDVRWIKIYQLFLEIDLYPDRFTYWFKTALQELRDRNLLSLAAIREEIAS